MERAGDVIPYIVKPMEELRDGSEQVIDYPKVCPINDQDTPVTLVRNEGEAAWRCPDCICGAAGFTAHDFPRVERCNG